MNAGEWILLALVIVLAIASIVIALRIRKSTHTPESRQVNLVSDRHMSSENPIPRTSATWPSEVPKQFVTKRAPLPRSDSSERRFTEEKSPRRSGEHDPSGLSTSPMTPGHPLFPLYVGGGLGADSERSNFPNDRGGDSNDSSSPSGGYEATPTPTTSSWSSSSGDGWGGHSSSHSSDHSGGYSGGSDSGGSFGGDSGGGGDGGGGGE